MKLEGLGIDLVSVERIRRAYRRFPERFPRRILGSRELSQFERASDQVLYLAGRFAAKEAAAKALGTGIRGFSFSDMEILRGDLGRPEVTGRHKVIPDACRLLVSITHTDSQALAVAVLCKVKKGGLSDMSIRSLSYEYPRELEVASAAEMRGIDRRAIEQYGIPGSVLMENAGRNAAEEARRLLAKKGARVVIVAGKGNNGGDGYVVARYLKNWGFAPSVFVAGKREDISGDALLHLKIILHSGIEVTFITHPNELTGLGEADLIVDGLLGTGVKGEVRGIYREIIELINSAPCPVLSLDLPSGVSADGSTGGPAVNADVTVTFGLLKRGLFHFPGRDFAGEIRTADIGLPRKLTSDLQVRLASPGLIRSFLKERPQNAHKGDAGRVLVIGGSTGFSGAPALAALGALRAGAGLVTVCVPEPLHDIMEAKVTEAMTRPLAASEAGTLSRKSLDGLLDLLQSADAVVAGPGMTTSEDASLFLEELIAHLPAGIPLVLDADGLNISARKPELLARRDGPVILTPHPGEMARLSGVDVKAVNSDRVEAARTFAQKHGVILLLKGAYSVTAGPQGEAFINPTGHPGMASGGMGDVLAGMVGAICGESGNPLHPAAVAAFLHGLAAEIAGRDGQVGITAADVAEMIPQARRAVMEW